MVAEGQTVAKLHGRLAQSEQARNAELFLKGNVKVLVATDSSKYLKRGYDNPRVTLVVNVDLPEPRVGRENSDLAVDFVHRVGRAGRWDKKGMSVSFVASQQDIEVLGKIEREEFMDHTDQAKCHPFIPVEDVMVDLASRAEELGKQN